ncbi:MAG: FAD/NAD(P)-binding protein, partial [Candidatus Omnitrophica bacterium]|nr:FAD/NAD(P)-binding protein [Candidatus Omnitrophota bacterium]
MHNNIYQPVSAIIEEIIEETPTIKSYLLRPEGDFSFSTGQFIELSYNGAGEAPFTPSSDPNLKDKLEVSIMNVGRLTSKLHNLNKNVKVGLRGPYGKGYPLEEFKNREILIVGGGVGLAPLRSLILSLFAQLDQYRKVLLRYGARTPKDMLYRNLLCEWSKHIDLVTTVDASEGDYKGNVGLVTTILKDLPIGNSEAVCVVCGPPIMMKFTTLKLIDLGFRPENIYLSMEKNMSCGLGKCGHCRIGKYYACK